MSLPRRSGSLGPRSSRSASIPNGLNINDGCGSTHPTGCRKRWSPEGADIGLALDGDADRLVVVDEKGRMVDGDQMMALIALDYQKRDASREP
jgi:phosphoglucosamine mutase